MDGANRLLPSRLAPAPPACPAANLANLAEASRESPAETPSAASQVNLVAVAAAVGPPMDGPRPQTLPV